MPNRILRDWTDSEKIDELSIHAERFFIRLIMKVDDYGRYTSNLKLLKSTLFPLKTDIRETDISLWLTECEQCGLIALYHVASKEYVQINNFRQTLRQKVEKYPRPPNECLADATQTHSGRSHETKRNETKRDARTQGLSESNLFRKPDIPSKSEVLEAFLSNSGTKEMAKKFYETYEATGWYYKNSPIKNFKTLVYSFVENWKKNEPKPVDNSLPHNLTRLNS